MLSKFCWYGTLDVLKSGEFLILGLTMESDGNGLLLKAIAIADIDDIANVADIADIADITDTA